MINVHPTDKAPLTDISSNTKVAWIQYFIYNKNKCNENFSRLMPYATYFESELASLVMNTQDSLYFHLMNDSFKLNKESDNMAFFFPLFKEYCEQCQKLKKYIVTSIHYK
ncbi:MAG: hypothetical protein D3922_00735 [Candidatus Electrothrix sp. AR1]|nr:hypothetical protein [Candidatus Electrothrix sp. AR1]